MRLPFVFVVLSLATACKKQPSPTVFIDPALATLVSPDTIALAGIRMEQLRETPVFKRYFMQGKVPPAERFQKETGLDLRKDVWEVLLAYDGKSPVAMLRGKFAEMGMEPKIHREGAQRFGYKGLTMLGDEETAVAFLNPSTVIAGPTPAVLSTIDRRHETRGPPKTLDAKVKQIPSTNQAWFVADVSGRVPSSQARDLGRWSAIAKLLGNVQLVWGGIDMRKGVDASIKASVPSDENAQQLKDSIRGLIGFARLNTADDRRQLLRLYDGIRVETGKGEVHIRVEVPEDLLDELIRLSETVSGLHQ